MPLEKTQKNRRIAGGFDLDETPSFPIAKPTFWSIHKDGNNPEVIERLFQRSQEPLFFNEGDTDEPTGS